MQETNAIRSMFDDIVERYDFLNHTLSFFQDYSWRRAMVREMMPVSGGAILDLATGTGDSATGFLKKGLRVCGADLSLKMLGKIRTKISDPGFMPVTASGYALPFRDAAFDGVSCAFGIRNMHQTPDALKEIYRVLKQGGKAVFLEFTMPRNALIKAPYSLYLKHIMPNIAMLFSKKEAYDYLWESITNFYNPDQFSKHILDAGFACCRKRPLSFGCVYIHAGFKA